jgi:hypothetical protein
MKTISLCFLLSCTIFAVAQKNPVQLKKTGKSANDFVPPDHVLLNQQTGDLNADGIADLVFVIQGTDTNQMVKDPETGNIDTNKRILAIYFGDSLGYFHLYFQNADFIHVKSDPFADDPFNLLEITPKGVLKIGYNYWASMGTWETSTEKYLFRFNKERKKFELIGYAYSWFMRNSFEGEDKSVNFPAGKMSITTNPMQDEKAKPVWKTFTLDPLKTLDEIAEPGSWEFMGMYI